MSDPRPLDYDRKALFGQTPGADALLTFQKNVEAARKRLS